MEKTYQELKTRLMEIQDLRSASAVLGWDQMTYMPPGGAEARGRQMATLQRLAHEKLTDAAVGKLLDALRPYEEGLPYESDEASLIRVARRVFERATRVPSSFVAELNNHLAQSLQAWTVARPANDFAAVRPHLERTLELSRQYSEYFEYEHIADPLISEADYGMKAATIRQTFAELREKMVPIVRAITEQPPADDSCLYRHYPEKAQWDFALEMVQAYGYDMERGRQDKAPHPFTTSFSVGDVRITTRVRENHLNDLLFSTLHEAGHGMYEQGVDPQLDGTLLAEGTSAGMHESQSRLWENLVGRSRGCWEHFYPKLQATFPDALQDVSLDTFYRAINKVQKSLIRTEADEVTYNLHVMLRFDFELAMLEGTLAVKDLPEAWRARFQADLGIEPPDDRDGVMQDVHWFFGPVGGMFQGYTLGNILGAQLYETALQAHPEITQEMTQGRFGTLHTWLQENIYRHGTKFTAEELMLRTCGQPMNVEPYIRYLRCKYGELYEL